jgi:hypothetical protein
MPISPRSSKANMNTQEAARSNWKGSAWFCSISRAPSVEREQSFYGDEESVLPPEMLYSEQDALPHYVKGARFVQKCIKY